MGNGPRQDILEALSTLTMRKYAANDALLYKNKQLAIDSNNFETINSATDNKELFFIDGGQAELLLAGNFVLSFIRICALGMKDNKKTVIDTRECYVLVKATGESGRISYSSEVFDVRGNVAQLLDSNVLTVDSNDTKLRSGNSRAPITKIVNMARRFMELGLAKEIAAKNTESFVLLDGSLDAKYPKEDEIIASLPNNISALAKTNSLFTVGGSSPTVLLSQLDPNSNESWVYSFQEQLHFVKLNPKAQHVFRFDGNTNILFSLLKQSSDPIFLGYPYGLILVDKLARVSEKEKSQLKAQFLLRKDLAHLKEHLASSNAHEILDRIG